MPRNLDMTALRSFVTVAETTDPSVVFPSRHEEYGTTYNITVSKKF